MAYWLRVLLCCIASYLIGGVLFGRIISKLNKKDITKEGSGNPGTSNMLRTQGAKLGFLTLILDMFKGTVCAISTYFICGGIHGGWQSNLALYLAGMCAVIGHIYPVYFKFKGGKGVATAAGAAFAANPVAVVVLFILHWILLYFTKIAAVVSFVSAISFVIVETVLLCLRHYYFSLIPLYIMLLLIVWAHRANIKRLINKTEGKLDLRESIEIDKKNKEQKRQQKQDKQQ